MSPDSLLYLCNFDEKSIDTKNEVITRLWASSWSVEDTELLKTLISSGLETEALVTELKNLKNNGVTDESVLSLAISTFLTFCDHNWNTHPEKLELQEYLGVEWPKDIDVTTKLQKDSEPIYVNILYPELLYLSSQLFGALCVIEQNLLNLWWHFRSKVMHQRALEDTSASLYSELELLMAKLSNELAGLKDQPRLQILLCTEISQAYLVYGRVQGTEEYLTRAREIAGLKLELTGVLGKRTKHQQTVLPQLALSSELEASMERPSAEDSHGASELPPDIELNDDVRLNKIQYNDKISQAALPSLEQILCLLTVQYLQKSQARDELMNEEIQPYIEAILTQKTGAWSTRVAALLIRCKIESTHKRTVERAMLQCETIVNDKRNTSPTTRLSYLWAAGLQPAWSWRQQLADLCVSLGLVKAALDHYLRLELWEDVIVCYTILQLRHKAAEIIQKQIDINPTVKLYCLLGDATDDVKCYEKAWEFSKYKSSRAQRHWGNYLFERKKYEECIPHFEKSVEINSIQEGVWVRLGYAALVSQQWETAAAAYRRYTYLQPASFEAWNNLAKVYLNQGQKERAHAALMEALRYNYDNWKLWENVIMVSIDTGHLEDVVRGVHRLLELVHKYEDGEVLALLVRAVLADVPLPAGGTAARLRKQVLELLGRVTSVHQNRADIWQLYSDLSPTELLAAQRLLKAYRAHTQNGNWPNNPESCKHVVELATSLLELSLKARQGCEDKDILQANSQLSSARLTGQAVLRAAEKQDWPEVKELLPPLEQLFTDITQYMKTIM